MLKRLIIVIVFSALVFGGLFGTKIMQIQSAQANRQAPPPPVVAVATVKEESWLPSLSTVGNLTVDAGIDITNEVAGTIKNIHFKSGEAVKKGQLLLEMDTATDEAELQRYVALQRLAKVRFNRSKKLIGDKMTSQSEYDENEVLLQEANATIELQKALLEKKRIKAPFDGRLGIRQINQGQYLPAGTLIVSLTSLEKIHADFSVPERSLAKLSVGQAIRVKVQAYPDELFEGTITAITPQIDAGTRSVSVRAAMDNPGERLQPGMFAYVEILMPEMLEVLTLPDTAITYNPYGEYVYVIEASDSGNTISYRQITTGATREGRVEITKGLKAGEQVVAAGQVKLRNGMAVQIDSKPSPSEREASE